MPSHPLDFQLQANNFSTPELAAVFDEQKKMNRWLQVEAALAASQAELRIIPIEAARMIRDKARLDKLDLELIRQGYGKSRNSLMPVINELRRACGEQFGQYVHYGATTQDILDTGMVLELDEGLQILYRDLRVLENILIDMSRRHRLTSMIGRTHGQQALPITFGLKTVIWAGEVRRQIQRLKALYPRVMVGQLSGAVGTMAAMGPKAREVAKQTMELLNLDWKAPGWHTSRDNMAEVASYGAILGGTLEKIANEIFLLGKTEVGELAEPPPQSMMSSAMPHKTNPVLCQRVVVLARHIRGLTTTVFEGMAHEHERDPRRLWSEWLALPQIVMYIGTAAAYLVQVLDGLVIMERNMQKNLFLHSDMVMSEWLLFRLAPVMGRIRAQEKLHGLLRGIAERGGSVREMLAADPEIGSLLNEDDMDELAHPERYIGLAVELIEETLAAIAAQRQTDQEALHR